MTSVWSPSLGALLTVGEAGQEPRLTLVARGDYQLHAASLWGLASDWRTLGPSVSVEQLQAEHAVSEAASYLRWMLADIGAELMQDVAVLVEEDLQTRASADAVLSQLLIAPLRDPERLALATHVALSRGCGATSRILDRARELQPQLNRMTAAWQRVPESCFEGSSVTRQELWCELAATDTLLQVLRADSQRTLSSACFTLLQGLPVQERRVVARVLQEWSRQLFGEETYLDPVASSLTKDEEFHESGAPVRVSGAEARRRFERTQRQIEEIVACVSKGHDTRALRFLEQLVASQKNTPELAVKSLCNLASRCKETYRSDIEHICLRRALLLRPTDGFALTQMGDHLKRSGQFPEAREHLQRAVSVSDGETADVATTSLASVAMYAGDPAQAEAILRGMSDGPNQVVVLTSLADLLRLTGRLGEAKRAYGELLDQDPSHSRSIAGLAEIAKREGDLERAAGLYQQLVSDASAPRRSRDVWRLALAHIHKRAERFDRALELVDDVVQGAPFFLEAQLHRSALLALMGKGVAELSAAPAGAQTAADEWLRQYVNGLLLCHLKRFKEARRELIDRFERTVVSAESEGLLRLAAAVCLLASHEVSGARREVEQAEAYLGAFERQISYVLQLHIAVLEKNAAQADRISKLLTAGDVSGRQMRGALLSLADLDTRRATACEVELLLLAI